MFGCLVLLLFLAVAIEEIVLFGADPFVALAASLVAVVVSQMDEDVGDSLGLDVEVVAVL